MSTPAFRSVFFQAPFYIIQNFENLKFNVMSIYFSFFEKILLGGTCGCYSYFEACHKGVWRRGGVAVLILNLNVSFQLKVSAILIPGKHPLFNKNIFGPPNTLDALEVKQYL
jgi:hypothetical protein